MNWPARRIALAVAFWILCSGSSSSEEWPSRERAWKTRVGGDDDHANDVLLRRAHRRNSTALSTIITSDDTRDIEQVQGVCLASLNVLDIRGGQDSSFLSNLLSNVNLTMEDGDESAQEQETTEEEQDAVPSKLSKKVTDKLREWKERRSISKQDFLDRMALVSSALLRKEHDAALDKLEEEEIDDAITHQSDLTRPGRYFTIVTTASLPWMTGTAVNPLLRAAHLVHKTREINLREPTTTQWVTLVVPWLELEEDRQELYGRVFQNQNEQEDYIRAWLRNEGDMPEAADPNTGLKIRFYPARYHSGLKSIFAMGDMCALVPDSEADICILEEPEHLNWYRAPGEGWTKKFHYVVGIVHTNYKEYASGHYSGLWTAPAIAVMSSAMVRAYCHKVIKLSDVLQTFAPEKEKTSNVHGVRSEFLKEGLRRAQEERGHADILNVMQVSSRRETESTSVYFIGKLLWAKGLDLMLDLEEYYKQCTGEYFAIDIYGSGPEQKDIMRSYHGRKQLNGNSKDSDESTDEQDSSPIFDASQNVLKQMSSEESPEGSVFTVQFKTRERLQKIKDTIKATTESLEFDLPKSLHELRRQPIPATFPGRVDHAILTNQYKVFVNPSVTEVLCTTTAEALAMGKFAIIPVHPSNTFFLRFPNCLAYRNKFEFVANLRWALTHDPEPLTPELARAFTWDAATDRLIEASAITNREALEREKLGLTKLDERIAWFHNELGKGVTGDMVRKVLGAGPASHQVKYQVAHRSQLEPSELIEQGEEEEESEDEDEGLPKKLRMSSFAAAIRSTVASGLPSLKAGSG